MSDSNPMIITDSPAISDNYVVALFDTEHRRWDADIIRDIFNNRDQEKILTIPLDESNTEDVVYWRFENTGLYTVKSAYKFLQRQRGCWYTQEDYNVWKIL